jgi:hypothetical protein
MMEVPQPTPVMKPVVAMIAATLGVLLLHVPPPVPSVSIVEVAEHIVVVPPIGSGLGYTVTVVVMKQPVGKVYVITAPPRDIPVTIPVVEPMVAIPKLLLLHVPPGVRSDKVVLAPRQIDVIPVIEDGSGFTVKARVEKQPVLLSA